MTEFFPHGQQQYSLRCIPSHRYPAALWANVESSTTRCSVFARGSLLLVEQKGAGEAVGCDSKTIRDIYDYIPLHTSSICPSSRPCNNKITMETDRLTKWATKHKIELAQNHVIERERDLPLLALRPWFDPIYLQSISLRVSEENETRPSGSGAYRSIIFCCACCSDYGNRPIVWSADWLAEKWTVRIWVLQQPTWAPYI